MSFLDRELDHFLAICEARSIGRAAADLGVTQPALTRSLQRLEARLGARLFVRAPRGVELTPIGTALRARAEKARQTLDDAEREVAQLAAGKIGRLRLGAGHMQSRLVAESLFPRLIVERPAASVLFHVAFNSELFERLDGGMLDLAVCGVLHDPPGLVFREILSTELTVAVRKGHPLTRIARPALRDLARFRAAAPGPGIPIRKLVEDRVARQGISMAPHGMESNSWEAMLAAVEATDLYTMAPVHEALMRTWSPRLVAVEVAGLDIKHRVGIVTRPDAYLSPLAERAIELIATSVADVTRAVTRERASRNGRAARVRS